MGRVTPLSQQSSQTSTQTLRLSRKRSLDPSLSLPSSRMMLISSRSPTTPYTVSPPLFSPETSAELSTSVTSYTLVLSGSTAITSFTPMCHSGATRNPVSAESLASMHWPTTLTSKPFTSTSTSQLQCNLAAKMQFCIRLRAQTVLHNSYFSCFQLSVLSYLSSPSRHRSF